MSWIVRFLKQPNGRYRDFQIVFTILTLNFVIPAFSYTFLPKVAVGQFLHINQVLGGHAYTFPEAGSRLWRYLGAANVMTLGFMCFLLQLDLRKYRAVLVPLVFMKFYAASMWLGGWIQAPEYPVLLAASILDYTTTAAFLFFGIRAMRQIAGRPDAELVPRPWSARKAGAASGGAPAGGGEPSA